MKNYYLETRVMLGKKTIAWDIVTTDGIRKTIPVQQVLEDSRNKIILNAIYCLYNDGLRGKGIKVQNMPSRQFKNAAEALKFSTDKEIIINRHMEGSVAQSIPEKLIIKVNGEKQIIQGEKDRITTKQIKELLQV